MKSKKATYRFREDMSWNIIGRFGRFLRMFGDMQTGLKKSFRCRKDQNSATNPCDPREVISLIVTHDQAQFTEIIRFDSVCAHTCRGMSIDLGGSEKERKGGRNAALVSPCDLCLSPGSRPPGCCQSNRTTTRNGRRGCLHACPFDFLDAKSLAFAKVGFFDRL